MDGSEQEQFKYTSLQVGYLWMHDTAGWFPAEERAAVFWHSTTARQDLLERNSKLKTNTRAEAEKIAINSEYY